jgi:hypothetical protein
MAGAEAVLGVGETGAAGVRTERGPLADENGSGHGCIRCGVGRSLLMPTVLGPLLSIAYL